MLGSLLVRGSAVVVSLVLVGGSLPPVALLVAQGDGNSAPINQNSLEFRGDHLHAPAGVHVLSDTSLKIGRETVEFPADVSVAFNEKGEAVFSLAKGARPHSWVLRIGKKKVVGSATARVVVPLLGVGDPRIEWSQYSFLVPPPRDHLQPAKDLKDPFDASPFR